MTQKLCTVKGCAMQYWGITLKDEMTQYTVQGSQLVVNM